MPTKVKEIQQTHYIVDQTYRGETMNSDAVIAGVIASSTGPCDEMVIESVAELVDLYSNSDSITSDADTTLQHAAKILQFSPIHVVRAANDNIKSGVTNNGDVIFTDKNYNPYKYSKTYEIKSKEEKKTGFIGFTNSIGEEDYKSVIYWGKDNNSVPTWLYENISSYDEKINLELPTNSDDPVGIDSLFKKIEELKTFPKLVGFDFGNKNSHVVYTAEKIDFDTYPGVFTSPDSSWLTIASEEIGQDVFKVETKDTDAVVNEGEAVVNINGNSFYLGVSDESKEISLPGTGIEVRINREDNSSITANTFSLYLFDELVKNDKIKNPIISDVDSSMTFTVVGGSEPEPTYVSFIGNMDDLIKIESSAAVVEIGDASSSNGTKGLRYTVNSDPVKFTIKSKVDASTLIEDERYLLINISKDEESYVGGRSPSGVEDKFKDKVLTLTLKEDADTLNELQPVTLTIKDEKGVVVATANTIPYVSKKFKNWDTSIKNISATYKQDNDGKYYIDIVGFKTKPENYTYEVDYTLVEFKPNSSNNVTIGLYFNQSSTRKYDNNTISVGKITVPLAVYKMGVAMDQFVKKHSTLFDIKDSCYSVKDVVFYGLRSQWRTASSSCSEISVINPIGVKRHLISKDIVNNTQQKKNYVLKIGNIVFWNGKKDLYVKSSNSEDTYRVGQTTMTFSDFMAEVNDMLPSFVSTIPSISDGNKITLLSNSKIDTVIKFGVYGEELESFGEDSVLKSYDYELSSRFAVIASYPSNSKIFGLKMVSNGDETFDITIRRKNDFSKFNVSFIPGAVDGYGNGIYFDYINSDMIDFKAIELNQDADPIEILEEISFGDEITVAAPGLEQRKNALSKFTLETGYYYSFLTELGYTNVSFDIFADKIANSLNAQYIFTAPKDYLTKERIISYRDSVGVDSRSSSMFVPFYKDNTLGSFVVDMSPSVQVLQRIISNKKLFKEFAPAFGPINGEVAVSTKMSSSSGLLVDFNKREDREELLSKQINMLRVDRGLGIVYINDTWTLQKKDSYLSDFNNMYMTNVIQHVLDIFMKQYFASANNKATRDNVVTVLTRALEDRLFANQQYTPFRLDVICDESNNPKSVVNDRKLIVDVKAFYEIAIKYIETYTRVLNLSEA